MLSETCRGDSFLSFLLWLRILTLYFQIQLTSDQSSRMRNQSNEIITLPRKSQLKRDHLFNDRQFFSWHFFYFQLMPTSVPKEASSVSIRCFQKDPVTNSSVLGSVCFHVREWKKKESQNTKVRATWPEGLTPLRHSKFDSQAICFEMASSFYQFLSNG